VNRRDERTRRRRVGLLHPLVVCAVLFVAASGQGAAVCPEYDLAACIETALHNNPDIAAAAADVALARAQIDEASANRFGRLHYSQQFGAVNGATGDILEPPKQNRNAILEDLGPFIRGEIELSVPLWTFGKLSAALEAAELGLRSREAGGEVQRAEVILDVKRLYYGLLLSRQLSVVLHDMLGHMDEAVAKTQKRLDGGSSAVTEIDLLKLRAGRAKFAKAVIDVDASSELTQRGLARAMGLPADAVFDIADRRLQPVAVAIGPLADYLAEGVPRRPELGELRAGIAAQSANVEREAAGYLPNLFFAGGFRYAYAPNRTEQSNPFAYDNFNYTFPFVLLGLQWDLSLLQTAARIDQARATLDELRARQRGAESGMALEVQKAYSDLQRARDGMQAAEAGRKAGRGLLILTVANFDLGIGEPEELFKGAGTYTEMSADYFRAVHDYNLAIATLGKAVGEELAPLHYDGGAAPSEAERAAAP
jgi:outer membrane protein TolC